MRPIRPLLIAASLVSIQGCSTAAPLARIDGNPARIVWTKGLDTAPFRDQNGVCHVFSRDTRAGLETLGTQVKACLEHALPHASVEQPHAKSVKVAWNKVPTERINEAYAASRTDLALLATSARRRSAPQLASVRGFFQYAGDVCHVVVPDRPDYVSTLGHEFKHCVDGLFHDQHGEWIRGKDAV